MIRLILFSYSNKAYGYDVTDWENKSSDWYDNLLTEDLVERVSEGDTVMYIGTNELAENWCEDNGYDYEFVEPDDNN
jgi:hypothetical protein